MEVPNIFEATEERNLVCWEGAACCVCHKGAEVEETSSWMISIPRKKVTDHGNGNVLFIRVNLQMGDLLIVVSTKVDNRTCS